MIEITNNVYKYVVNRRYGSKIGTQHNLRIHDKDLKIASNNISVFRDESSLVCCVGLKQAVFFISSQAGEVLLLAGSLKALLTCNFRCILCLL